MAVTIKLKQGSGSDPSASDLVAGEPAVRTDTGEIFLKKDDGSVAKVSGGVDDGDKGDITVSSSGSTWTIDNDAVTYAKIQNVSATDRILGRDSSGAGVIEEITPANLRTMLGLAASATTDTTNASNISSGTLAAGRVATLNQDTSGNAATATALETARTIAGVSFDGSANISLNNNAITNGAGYITSADGGNAATLDGIDSTSFLRSDATDIKTAGHLTFNDNIKSKFGTGGDTEIYFDGSNGYIDQVAGDLYIRATDTDGDILMQVVDDFIVKTNNGGTNAIRAYTDAGVELYFDGTKRIETASGGVAITGRLDCTEGIDIDANNQAFRVGASQNLQLVYTGSAAEIKNIDAATPIKIKVKDGNEDAIICNPNGSVDLYYDNSKKFETVTGGATITGVCTATSFAGDGSSLTGIAAGATGGGSDEIFWENGQNVTSNYTITNNKNAMSAGPITIDSGVTVTVGSGETWTVV